LYAIEKLKETKMNIKDCQIDFLRWVLQNCKNSPYDVVALENVKVKNLFPNDSVKQDLFYLDSNSDMEKLYKYYEKDNE